jgi:hypothetical protein
VKKIPLILLWTLTLWGCENPYIVHNLIRPVTATAVEFISDKDGSNATPYALKPVFASNVMEYIVYVHEAAESINPTAYPETGASINFEEGSYIKDGVTHPVPFVNGAYAFPPDVMEIDISFKVYKDYRLDGVYTVHVQRRPDPGRLQNLKLTVGWYNAGYTEGVDNINDPSLSGNWVYETDNYMVNYDPSGISYLVSLPYYAQKLVIDPVIDPEIRMAYTVHPRDPQIYPDESVHIDYARSAVPQYIDYAAWAILDPSRRINGIFDYDDTGVPPQLCVEDPLQDSASGKKTSWLTIHTVLEDPDTGERRYPQDYRLKLVWEKSYAYLKDLKVEDDRNPAEERRLGNFFMGNTGYDAEVDKNAEKFTLTVTPRDAGSTVTIEQWTAMDGVPDPDQGTDIAPAPGSYAKEFAFPMTPEIKQYTAIRVVVENLSLPDNGRITYWVEVRRSEPLTRLRNIRIHGTVKGVPNIRLFEFDELNDDDGPDYIHSVYAQLKDPPSSPKFTLDEKTNFTLEFDGASVSELRLEGIPFVPAASGGEVVYNVGDNPAWPKDQNHFVFNGGTGATITAKAPGHKDRIYAFTLIRAGAQAIELWTDMREPPETGAMPNLSDPVLPGQEPLINNSVRGTFQAIIGGKAVNNALPDQEVTIRVTPRLGWSLASLRINGGTITTADVMPGPGGSLSASGNTISLSPAQADRLPQGTVFYLCPPDGTLRQSKNTVTGKSGNVITFKTEGSDLSYTADDKIIISNPAGYWEWTYLTPKETVKLTLSYRFSGGRLGRAAYVAPVGKAGRDGAYGTGPDGTGTSGNTGTCWAYATSNLQGVINAFTSGGAFDEIWLLEGTYRLDPPTDAANPAGWWASGLPTGDEKNRAFVLKEGLRIYGGFKGTEGSNTAAASQGPADLKAAREERDSSPAAALRTILSGGLRYGGYVRHVVIAAGIGSPPGDTAPRARETLSVPAGYDFNPGHDDDGIFGVYTGGTGNAGVTLLDTLSIRNGMRNTAGQDITVNSKTVNRLYGAGLYCVDASPWLRNVVISDSTAVMGGGMYSAGNSYPVLKDVVFSNNDATGYDTETGRGGGFANDGGLAALLGCIFSNNATIGGTGAGLYARNGKVFLRNAVFRYNNAASGGGFTIGGGETWVYDSMVHNNTWGGISNGGNLYLVNVTTQDISNSGTLSGTNLTVKGGFSNHHRLALVNSRLESGLTAAGIATALTNVVFAGGGLNFTVSQTNPDPGPDVINGCILTNVTFPEGGIATGYNSTNTHHHGAANLLLNSVRISGGSLGINQSSGYRDGKKGVYVTLNNVTVAPNADTALTASTPNYAGGTYDVLDLRIRNSVIMGNSQTSPAVAVAERRIVGKAGIGGSITAGSGNTITLNPAKADLLNVGDTFRITNGNAFDAALRPPVNRVTAKTFTAATDSEPEKVTVTFYATAAGSYDSENYLVLTDFITSLGVTGAAGDLSTGTLSLTPAQAALLPAGALFKIAGDVRMVTDSYPSTGVITFYPTTAEPYTATDAIMTNSAREGLGVFGSRLKEGNKANTWTLTPEQTALFSLGTTFRLRDALTDTLKDSVCTVMEKGGSNIYFNADAFEPYTGYDRIILDNGEIGGSDDSLVVGTNTWTLTSGQTALFSLGTTFRIRDALTDTLKDSVCTVTALDPDNDPLTNDIEFTADSADSYSAADHIMIDTGTIGAGNSTPTTPSQTLTNGTGKTLILPLPGQAALFSAASQDNVYRIADGDPDGALKAGTLTVTGVDAVNNSITFNVSGAPTGGITCAPGDYFVQLSTDRYVNLPGAVSWLRSTAGGANSAPGAGATGFIDGAGKGRQDVLDGSYRPLSSSGFINGGDTSIYPANAVDLVKQCFERYKEKWNKPAGTLTDAETSMKELLDYYLFTWTGTPAVGSLNHVTIDTFLGNDNSYNVGDLRPTGNPGTQHNRFSGVIDVGAYEN